jgi:hypothetical protein
MPPGSHSDGSEVVRDEIAFRIFFKSLQSEPVWTQTRMQLGETLTITIFKINGGLWHNRLWETCFENTVFVRHFFALNLDFSKFEKLHVCTFDLNKISSTVSENFDHQ